MTDDETVNDLLRTLNSYIVDIRDDLKGIREALEKANEEKMETGQSDMEMVGGFLDNLRHVAIQSGAKLVELVDEEELAKKGVEGEGKKVVELVDEEKIGDRAEKIVDAAVAILTAESCPECSDYAVSEKGDKHMCRRSEPEGRYIPGSFIIEGTIPDWCPFSLGTKEEEEES